MGCSGSKDSGSPKRSPGKSSNKSKVSQSQVNLDVNGRRGSRGEGDNREGDEDGSDVNRSGDESGDDYNSDDENKSSRQNGSLRRKTTNDSTNQRRSKKSKSDDRKKSRKRTNKVAQGDTGDNNDDEERKSSPKSKEGFKRQIRQRMVKAAGKNDLDELEKQVKLFKKNRMVDEDGDYKDALDKLSYLQLKRDLRDGMMRKHYETLDAAVEDAMASPHKDKLQREIEEARKMRDHLQELDQHSHSILKMDQSTFSEIHRYHRPPHSIHETMMASFLLLGEKERNVIDWQDVQALLGKIGRDSVRRRIVDFDSVNVADDTCEKVADLLNRFDLDEVRDASNGAAAFYVWSSNILTKIENDKEKEKKQQKKGKRGKNKSKNNNEYGEDADADCDNSNGDLHDNTSDNYADR